MSIVNQVKRSHLADLGREVLRRAITRGLDFSIAFETQSEKIVVLANDLAGGTGKVQCERRHLPTQIVDVENQIFREVNMVAPYHPSDTERSQAKLVS